MSDIRDDFIWAILPDGLQEFFDLESFQKTDTHFRITLTEKNIVPDPLPEQYHGKKIINTTLTTQIVDSFPIRDRKTEITLKRRWWKFDGVDQMLMRDIDPRMAGTRLEKEFAECIKKINRAYPRRDQ
jgi:hypothetical protein